MIDVITYPYWNYSWAMLAKRVPCVELIYEGKKAHWDLDEMQIYWRNFQMHFFVWNLFPTIAAVSTFK